MESKNVRLKKIEKNSTELVLTWDDNHRQNIQKISVRRLREECPCAPCQSERSGNNDPLALPTFKEEDVKSYQINDIALIGNYAIALRWKDGHATGIYPFEMLKALGAQN